VRGKSRHSKTDAERVEGSSVAFGDLVSEPSATNDLVGRFVAEAVAHAISLAEAVPPLGAMMIAVFSVLSLIAIFAKEKHSRRAMKLVRMLTRWKGPL